MTIRIETNKIEAVNREIAGGFRFLVFSPDLERQFEDDLRRERERYLIVTGQLATVLYDLFLFCDWLTTPDVFKAAVVARLCILTPLFLVTWYLVKRRPPTWLREGLAAVLVIIAAAVVMRVLVMSKSPGLASYQYGTVLIMLFSAVVQRLRIRYAFLTIVIILCIQIIALGQLHDVDSKIFATSASFFATAAILLLWAAYSLEREQRRSYLLDLRSQILNTHLDRLAKNDPLTGLWNRRHLQDVVAATDARLTSRPVSVILLDIDHFKSFNDAYGHVEGDACLKAIGSCVRDAVDGMDDAVAIRYGGEEFLVLMDGADPPAAMRAASRIRAAIKAASIPHPVLGDGLLVTASVGVASGYAPAVSVTTLVKAADDALYDAKDAGRDRIRQAVVVCDAASRRTDFDFDARVMHGKGASPSLARDPSTWAEPNQCVKPSPLSPSF